MTRDPRGGPPPGQAAGRGNPARRRARLRPPAPYQARLAHPATPRRYQPARKPGKIGLEQAQDLSGHTNLSVHQSRCGPRRPEPERGFRARAARWCPARLACRPSANGAIRRGCVRLPRQTVGRHLLLGRGGRSPWRATAPPSERARAVGQHLRRARVVRAHPLATGAAVGSGQGRRQPWQRRLPSLRSRRTAPTCHGERQPARPLRAAAPPRRRVGGRAADGGVGSGRRSRARP